jgi:hypothetical protein
MRTAERIRSGYYLPKFETQCESHVADQAISRDQ